MGSAPTRARRRTERAALAGAPGSDPPPLEAAGRRAPCAAAVVCGLLLGACASAPARVALQGDLPALQAAIAAAEAERALDESSLEELAQAVLRRELLAQPAAGELFPDLRACTAEVRPALESVVRRSGEHAAPAALALLDAGFEPPVPAAAGLARASLEARRATGPDAGERRRVLMLHGDAEVRRAALGAALEVASAEDVPALAEAARLDPDARARALAVRALGRIGGDAAVLALGEAYVSADRELRREVVLAWAQPASFPSGGQRALEELASGEPSEPSVLAAAALGRRAPESALLAASLLSKAIEGPGREARWLAIELAPWGRPELRAARERARQHEDPATRALAALRSVEAGEAGAEVLAELEELAKGDAAPSAAVARAGLARAGRASVAPALRRDLAAPTAARRTLAALSLHALGDWAGAARALGDDSPAVRRGVACHVLAGPKDASALERWVRGEWLFGAGSPELVPLLASAAG